MFRRLNFLLWMSLLLSSCSPSSLEDFHYEGKVRCRALIEELQTIHNREDLTRALPRLKKHFNELVDLMIDAREFQEKHSDEEAMPDFAENSISSLLEQELRRIYAIDGGREIIESAQHEALVRLDAFERACIKKRQSIR